LAHAAQPIGMQAPEVHPLFEVYLHVAGGLERAIPPMPGVGGVGGNGLTLRRRSFTSHEFLHRAG
jgi:hypothetical protein